MCFFRACPQALPAAGEGPGCTLQALPCKAFADVRALQLLQEAIVQPLSGCGLFAAIPHAKTAVEKGHVVPL